MATVKAVMEALKEDDPEEVLAKRKQEGFCYFSGLPQLAIGEARKMRRFRARGMAAFLTVSSATRVAIVSFLEDAEIVPLRKGRREE